VPKLLLDSCDQLAPLFALVLIQFSWLTIVAAIQQDRVLSVITAWVIV
jgi:hypothetical protein